MFPDVCGRCMLRPGEGLFSGLTPLARVYSMAVLAKPETGMCGPALPSRHCKLRSHDMHLHRV